MNKIPAIGIASSIARESGFSWEKTMEFASIFDTKIVQLFLIETMTESFIDQFLNKYDASIDQLYLHLPPHGFNISILKDKWLGKIGALIQHERYFDQSICTIIQSKNLYLGLENDQDSDLNGYLNQLTQLHNDKIKTIAVLDIPRFYHQYSKAHHPVEIDREIKKIMIYCKKQGLEIIIHAIDHLTYNADRRNWAPMLRGSLPWTDIFTFIELEQIPVQNIILEYESFEQARDSIVNLKAWSHKQLK